MTNEKTASPRRNKRRVEAKDRDDNDNRDTTSLPGASGSVSGQGRKGGRLARDIGSRDELKRATERPAGTTRVRKSDEEEEDT